MVPDQSAIVIGGGLAGLAAAAALAARGTKVTLLESRPRLGGRASSFSDRATGALIDNCQHVSMGCCTNFTHFCQTVGIDRLFRRERVLYFIGPNRKTSRLKAAPLPAPLHLLPSFAMASYLSATEKRQIAKVLAELVRIPNPDDIQESFADWLAQRSQSPRLLDRFWRLILVSALSERLDRISVGYAQQVFANAFLANRAGWEICIPTVPLDQLYGGPLTRWLSERGVTVRLQSGVERLVSDGSQGDGSQIESVLLRSGEALSADHYVLAVPHHVVLPMLPDILRTHTQFDGLERLEAAPISSVHLWFDRPITSLPHAVFVERLSQWMFNRDVIMSDSKQEPLDGKRFYYQVVISESRDLAGQSQDQVIAKVVQELTDVWPEAEPAELQHARLVTEHKAVFSPLPGVDTLRPEQQSPLPNLQLAGDWTRTGWPATMEGAVRSGYLAAENILRHVGRPETLLQVDLPTSQLSKLLFGL